jgi:membrane protein implicated in regulation of membrane protease activity
MGNVRISPGPAETEAFRLGIVSSIVLGAAAIGILSWIGVLTPVVGYVFVVLFPIYLLLVAVALNVWLNGLQDTTALRPVYRTKKPK